MVILYWKQALLVVFCFYLLKSERTACFPLLVILLFLFIQIWKKGIFLVGSTKSDITTYSILNYFADTACF